MEITAYTIIIFIAFAVLVLIVNYMMASGSGKSKTKFSFLKGLATYEGETDGSTAKQIGVDSRNESEVSPTAKIEVDDGLRSAHQHALNQVQLKNKNSLQCPVSTLLHHLDNLYKSCGKDDVVKGFDLDPLRWHYDSMTHRNYFGGSNTAALKNGTKVRRIFTVSSGFILDDEIFDVLQIVLYEQLSKGVNCRLVKYEDLGPKEREQDVVLIKGFSAVEHFDDLGSTKHMAILSNDSEFYSSLNARFERLWETLGREITIETMPRIFNEVRQEYAE